MTDGLPSPTPARGSQCARVLAVLKDGRPHTIQEIHERAGTMRLNSRVAELRKRGHDIICWKAKLGRDWKNRDRWTYYYRLRLPTLGAADTGGPGAMSPSAAPSVEPPVHARQRAAQLDLFQTLK